ncbi:MAG: TylF/MycF/NovP-related O-methyltransferase [Acidobacteriota bacterium]|nr:TylF/MycF/NovP-related O-methyltransferase [Acidobacteriota bacterium]
MIREMRQHLANWKANPRRAELPYIFSRLRELARNRRPELEPPLDPPVETSSVALLHDPAFLRSVAQVKDRTCLDAPRLANLWTLVRTVGPGKFLEVGSFRGGTALHLCNAIDCFHPGSPFYSFDPFEQAGFENLTDCDHVFKAADFTNTRYEEVRALLAGKPNAQVMQGFFPAAAAGLELDQIAFCHLDVDIYAATRDSLNFLSTRLAPRSAVMLDDLDHCETPGVRMAVEEFLAGHPGFLLFPVFPCQGILISKALW